MGTFDDAWSKFEPTPPRARAMAQYFYYAGRVDERAATSSPAAAPVPMVLHCPECRTRHVDVGEFATKVHHTHSCQGCGLTWRPAVVATVGVQFLPGFKNEEPANVAAPPPVERVGVATEPFDMLAALKAVMANPPPTPGVAPGILHTAMATTVTCGECGAQCPRGTTTCRGCGACWQVVDVPPVLQRLTPEELAKAPPLDQRDIDAAIARGERDRRLSLGDTGVAQTPETPCGPCGGTGRYVRPSASTSFGPALNCGFCDGKGAALCSFSHSTGRGADKMSFATGPHTMELRQLVGRMALGTDGLTTMEFGERVARAAYRLGFKRGKEARANAKDQPERCESGCAEPVTRHDVDNVPLCEECWKGLVDDAATEASATAPAPGETT